MLVVFIVLTGLIFLIWPRPLHHVINHLTCPSYTCDNRKTVTFWKIGGGFDVICTLVRSDNPFAKRYRFDLSYFEPCVELRPYSVSVNDYYFDAEFNVLIPTIGSLILAGGLTFGYLRLSKRKTS